MKVLLRTISWKTLLGVGLALGALTLTTTYSYLLFHSLAELFSIAIACGIFFLAWNSRRYHHNDYLLFIGVAYVFVAFFDILHTLAYKGMGVFQGIDDNNLPPQLWMVGRYIEALSLLAAPAFLHRRIKPMAMFIGYAALSGLAVFSLFLWKVFPDCFLPGVGLTFFKIASEYVIIAILIGAGWLLVRNRGSFDPDVLRLLLLAILSTIATEFCFTLYVSLYATSNLVGHLFKIVSFWFLYQAIIVTGLTRPYDLLFRDLQQEIAERKQSEAALHEAHAFYRTILDRLPIIIGYWDKNLCNRFGNQAYSDWFNIDPGAMPGMHIKDVIGEELYHLNLPYLEGALAGNPQTFERAIPTLNGKAARYSLTNYIPDTSGGDVQGFFVLLFDITENKRIEESLRQSQESYKLLLESTGEGIYGIDLNGDCTFSNPACLRMLGYSCLEELLGKNMHWLIHHSYADGSHFKVEDCRIFQAFQQGEGTHVDDEVLWRADGSSFPAEYWSSPQLSDGKCIGAVVTFVDITERKQIEQALQETRALLDYTQAIGKIGGFAINLDTRQHRWTEEMYRVLGHSGAVIPDVAEGTTFFAPEDRQLFLEVMHRADELGEPIDVELRLMPQGTTNRWIRLVGKRDDKDGARILTGTVQDITDNKALEMLRDDIDIIIRHDLKTPLNGIVGLPQIMLNDSNLTPDQVEYLQAIEQSGWKMLRQINMSLDIMKMERGQYQLNSCPFDLLSTIRKIASGLQAVLQRKALSVEILVQGKTATDTDTFVVNGEEQLCSLMLSNLFTNAIEASPKGERITVSLSENTEHLICIRNLGVVPTEIRERFFEKYVTSGKTTGTGLGTYSVRLFARSQGGDVELDTSEERTTTVTVRLPRINDQGDV